MVFHARITNNSKYIEHSCVLGIVLRGGKTKTHLEIHKHKLFQGISLFASDLKIVGAKRRKSWTLIGKLENNDVSTTSSRHYWEEKQETCCRVSAGHDETMQKSLTWGTYSLTILWIVFTPWVSQLRWSCTFSAWNFLFYGEEKPDTLSFDMKSVHIQYISFYNSFLNIFCTFALQSSLY